MRVSGHFLPGRALRRLRGTRLPGSPPGLPALPPATSLVQPERGETLPPPPIT